MSQTIEERALAFLKHPPVTWDARYAELSETDRYDLQAAIDAIAIRAARAGSYIGRRQTGGKHADAVKAQNTAARKVRQALGYTYADDAITF